MTQPALLMPVENQVRELDARLLLACVAARRGLHSIIGFKRDVEFSIASFPRSVFISKSIRIGNRKIFPIARELGHEIVAWDEEALVHLPPEMYYSRRLSTTGMVHISHLFAWGEDNAELWRKYPHLPPDMPIHVTGNPRGDLLRPEICAYYSEAADDIRKTYGRFILVNTNFNHVNAFYPAQNLFQPVAKPGDMPEFGQAARGMSREYAEGLRDHKQAVLDDFLRLIPDLETAFPDCAVVVRPHPTENQEIYGRIASRCTRVKVTNEGNVIPWLLAAQALIHNGCTTGVEAFAVR
ncbi:MAG TPA: surface carbohydrate biosynthesis protein, partial [Desulfobacterales bacterium]|nr:surface carbohydrate biosynthesis protein [Desulfobacterales bacterium]